MKPDKEAFAYIICGCITTFVNYILYTFFLFLRLPYLSANSIAWCGAVLAAYVLNRRLVFHSVNKISKELISFFGLRFLTLWAENFLLWLLISHMNISPFPSKFLVSVITVTGNYILCKYNVFKKEDA